MEVFETFGGSSTGGGVGCLRDFLDDLSDFAFFEAGVPGRRSLEESLRLLLESSFLLTLGFDFFAGFNEKSSSLSTEIFRLDFDELELSFVGFFTFGGATSFATFPFFFVKLMLGGDI